MKIIPLSQGKTAVVDDEDYERVSKHKWSTQVDRASGKCYAVRTGSVRDESGHTTGRRERIYLHREVLTDVAKDHRISFRDDNSLNCQKANLQTHAPWKPEADAVAKPRWKLPSNAHETALSGIYWVEGPSSDPTVAPLPPGQDKFFALFNPSTDGLVPAGRKSYEEAMKEYLRANQAVMDKFPNTRQKDPVWLLMQSGQEKNRAQIVHAMDEKFLGVQKPVPAVEANPYGIPGSLTFGDKAMPCGCLESLHAEGWHDAWAADQAAKSSSPLEEESDLLDELL